MRNLLYIIVSLTLLLGGTSSAESPEESVRKLYESHLKRQSVWDTYKSHRQFFTPGFRKVIERDMKMVEKEPGTTSDFLIVGNGGFGDFELGRAWRSGATTIVPLTLYCGVRSSAVRTDPKLRAQWPVRKVHVLFADVGDGPQIYDLQFLARPATQSRRAGPAYSARRSLRKHTAMVEKWLREQKK